jgi:hypothetical protein
VCDISPVAIEPNRKHSEPRTIDANAFLHESVLKRAGALADYQPVNLPATYRVVPMEEDPARPG